MHLDGRRGMYIYWGNIHSYVRHTRGLSQRQLDTLSTKTFHDSGSLNSCRVCLAMFVEGEILRSLPCSHEFHAVCVDQWLSMNSTCPVCRGTVRPSSN
uniref:RING-type domain-containing protein n=1 Tax=Erpetoichthys calabaricus TaxID=27687 RepID=A0A8C4S6M2_ERPCA